MEKVGAGADTLLYPGLHPKCIFWLPAVVFTGIGNRTAYLAFLEFITSLMVAVGRQKHDAAAGTRQLGTAAVRFASDATAQ
ncbi:hypothetical protein SDC9_191960 [bioreactor metagenome]|uniref:Uncharacterized protein n=1 Tax=bioreactor metagenome TaxID=1076179 RepID=A0A645HZD1_9ZZZZ